MQSYTYLTLMIATAGFPLLLSFDKKVAYYTKWKSLIPAMVLTAAVFIIWDVWFTKIGVWSFNEDYLIGASAWGLPIEEWMFFFAVPFACVFIYECLIAYFPTDHLTKIARPLSFVLAFLLLLIGSLNPGNIYTLVTFYALAAYLLFMASTRAPFMGRFYAAYLISMVPFLIVNGILTYLPVVMYNDLENLGIRLGSIPVEDTAYSMLLLVMNISIYEWFATRQRAGLPQMEKRYE